jgi:hypothetical protein
MLPWPLHQRALIPDVLADVMRCLSPSERLLSASHVSREWRSALQRPSVWREGGWWCTPLGQHMPPVLPPPCLRSQLASLRCNFDWLSLAAPFADLSHFFSGHLRHLELSGLLTMQPQLSAEQLRSALSKLALQTLLLPTQPWADGCDLLLPPHLMDALTLPSSPPGAAGSSRLHPPLLLSWSSTLTRLRCGVTLAPSDAMLRAFSAGFESGIDSAGSDTPTLTHWPLRQLELTLRADAVAAPVAITATAAVLTDAGKTDGSVAATALLCQWLNAQSAPLLTSMQLHCATPACDSASSVDCVCAPACFALLGCCSRSLTELDANIFHRSSPLCCLPFLRLLSGDALPHLRWGPSTTCGVHANKIMPRAKAKRTMNQMSYSHSTQMNCRPSCRCCSACL